jgi:hypothetical protein
MKELILACLSLVLALFLGPLIGILTGAFVGWVVGWFFSETILGILYFLGIAGFSMWQVGAFLGFVGSFFRTYSNK